MIVSRNNKWFLYTKDGKKLLGEFPTLRDAEHREKQIIFWKNVKGEAIEDSPIKLKFAGTKGEIEEKNDKHHFNTGLIIATDAITILFDLGTNLTDEYEKISPDAIVITHAHPDHIAGFENKEIDVPVYMTKETEEKLDKTKFLFKNIKTISNKTKIGDLYITPIRVLHSILAPAVGYVIEGHNKKIGFFPDVLGIDNRAQVLDDMDVYIGDSSTIEKSFVRRRGDTPIGHASMKDQLRWIGEAGIPKVIFTHFGKEPVELGDEKLKEKLEDYNIGGANIVLAYDGFETAATEFPKNAIYLVKPHGEMIKSGSKTAIVKSEFLREKIGEPLYLAQEDLIYGIIKLGQPEEITIEEFTKRFNEHRITEEERLAWWPKADMLYLYPVTVLKKFARPKRYEYKPGAQTFINDVKFLDGKAMQIEDITPDTLSKVSDKELLNLHHRLHQLYNNFLRGAKLNQENLVNAHLFIVEEMDKRNLNHEDHDELDTETDKLDQATDTMNTIVKYPGLQELIEASFGDFVIVPDYISLIGSTATGENPNDIDCLLRTTEAAKDDSLVHKFARLFPQDMRDKLHFVFDPIGARSAHIPLYDLVLRKKPLQLNTVNEPNYKPSPSSNGTPYTVLGSEGINLFSAFQPMKSSGGYGESVFFKIDAMWNVWAKGFIEKGIDLASEPKLDGQRFTGHTDGKRVALYTEDKKQDRSSTLPQVAKELKSLNKNGLILDGEMVWFKEGKPLQRKDMIAIVSGKNSLEGEDIRWFCFDILYYDGKDLHGLPWEQRQEILKKVLPKDLKYIKRVIPTIVSNEKEFTAALTKNSREEASEGSMLKTVTSTYDITGKKTHEWGKFKNLKEIHVKVIGIRKKLPEGGKATNPTFDSIQSDTFMYRGAFLGDGNKLQAFDSENVLTESDFKLRWVNSGEKDPVTGQVASKSEWKGIEDPALWKTSKDFGARKVGDYAYGITYATNIKADIGDMITVIPSEIIEFAGKDGKKHLTWQHPNLKELDPTRHEPDTLDQIHQVMQAKASVGDPLKKDTEDLTRDEKRKIETVVSGDPFMQEQPVNKTMKFVQQVHIRGLWSDKDRNEFKSALREIAKLPDQEQEKSLAALWRTYDVNTLGSIKLPELKTKLKNAVDNKVDYTAELKKYISKEPPKNVSDINIEKLVNNGNAHIDNRFMEPNGNSLFGITADDGRSVLQFLDGNIEILLPFEIFSSDKAINILAERKAEQPISWMTLVSKEKPIYKVEAGEVGGTKNTAAEFHYLDEGEYVLGVQKTDAHEYFIFHEKNKQADGRWMFTFIQREQKKPGQLDAMWLYNSPKEQRPYITTHDKVKEEEKAKQDKIKMIWNENTIPTLHKLGYKNL